MKRLLFLALILLVMSNALFAAVTQNEVVQRVAGHKDEATFVQFYGTLSTAAGNKDYTQWVFIPDYTDANAYISCICSDVTGTEDMNVLVQYASRPDSTYRLGAAVAIDDLDATGITMKNDTLNVIGGATQPLYKTGLYMRLLFHAQSGHPTASVVSWFVRFRHNADKVTNRASSWKFNDAN